MDVERRPCPFCAEAILPEATVCRFCGRNLRSGWAGANSGVQGPVTAVQGAGGIKRRRAWLAGIFSLLAPGVGQLYNGEHGKGLSYFILFICLELAAALILPNLALKIAISTLILTTLIELVCRIGSAIAAFRRARRVGAISIGRYQHGWIYVVLVLLMPIANAVAAPEYNFQSFWMPAGSMVPTLLVGDWFIVDRGQYRVQPPRRGDVAVFKLPTDPSIDYIKRIVGLPGDHIQMRHGNLYINDQLVPRRPVDDYVYEEGGAMIVLHQYIESLPRGAGKPPVEYPIIKVGDDGPLDNTPVYDVPLGNYFGMGDNRDNSQDSRVLSAVGYVPARNQVGKAQFILFSTDGAARWWEIWKWPFA